LSARREGMARSPTTRGHRGEPAELCLPGRRPPKSPCTSTRARFESNHKRRIDSNCCLPIYTAWYPGREAQCRACDDDDDRRQSGKQAGALAGCSASEQAAHGRAEEQNPSSFTAGEPTLVQPPVGCSSRGFEAASCSVTVPQTEYFKRCRKCRHVAVCRPGFTASL